MVLIIKSNDYLLRITIKNAINDYTSLFAISRFFLKNWMVPDLFGAFEIILFANLPVIHKRKATLSCVIFYSFLLKLLYIFWQIYITHGKFYLARGAYLQQKGKKSLYFFATLSQDELRWKNFKNSCKRQSCDLDQ